MKSSTDRAVQAVKPETASSDPPMGEGLPWERKEGAPEGVGICLSGGGLRAASFGMGVLQGLQKKRGLLFGKDAADHLSVVSGGSYIASTFMLNAADMARNGTGKHNPLEEGSPEAEHVLGHGEYLKSRGAMGRMAGGVMANLFAFFALFAFAGLVYAFLTWAFELLGIGHVGGDLVSALFGIASLIVGGKYIQRNLYRDLKRGDRYLRFFAGLLMVGLGAPSLVRTMEGLPPFSRLTWWFEDGHLLCVVLIVGAAAFALYLVLLLAGRAKPPKKGRAVRAAGVLFARVPAVPGFIVFGLLVTFLDREADKLFDPTTELDFILPALGSVILLCGVVLVMQYATARVSLHGIYRDRLSDCFSVIRSGNQVIRVDPTAQPLSGLEPPTDPDSKFPRLLVCATANLAWDPSKRRKTTLCSTSPGKRQFASFVYSHDRCGIPGVADASFSTKDLEKLERPKGLGDGGEPIVSLMTAVTSTGAAVSPAMGKNTIGILRPILALANLRLGSWLWNPLSKAIREEVSSANPSKELKKRTTLGASYDELIPELFGLQAEDTSRFYVSDGGHYDNLGLLTLLHAKCRTIWCVDSSADSSGRSGQLRNVIDLARDELKVDIRIDLTQFRSLKGIADAGHQRGSVTYSDGSRGEIIVIKLGLTKSAFGQVSSWEKAFPHHDTFMPPWKVMWYHRDRMDNYRKLGYIHVMEA